MKKFGLLLLALGLLFTGCSNTSASISGNFTAYIEGDDWGCGVNKVVLELDQKVSGVTKDTFVVEETKQDTMWTKEGFPVEVVTNPRTILAAYTCDVDGKIIEESSQYVAIEMEISPMEGSNLLFSMATQYNSYSDPYELSITLAEDKTLTVNSNEVTDFKINSQMIKKVTNADAFKVDSFKASDDVEYGYAGYVPDGGSDTLVVWLHGLGEGGSKSQETDPYVAVLANKATTFISDEFQCAMGGANILVPQCPTFWMDGNGDGDINGGNIQADGTSYYTKSLYELINSYKEETGSKKVVIAGCSNGGYMTLLLAIEYGNEFDAYVPICEAIPDSYITDEQIIGLKDVPLYFIYSTNDSTVVPEKHEIPTINRLKKVGAKNLHVSTLNGIFDTSGRFKNEDGQPHEYNGHWAWINFYNNEANCDETGITVWQWMADQ